MESLVVLLIFGLILTFGSQLLKGVGNIFSISGRIFGWILGIVLILFLVKTYIFSDNVNTGSNVKVNTIEHAEQNLGKGITKEGEYFILDGDKFKWNESTEEYDWIED